MIPFSIAHRFPAPPERVIRAMLDPACPPWLGRELDSIVSVEVLGMEDDGHRVYRRIRWTPRPLIARVGPKLVQPEWMAWDEESVWDHGSNRISFVNTPVVADIAARFTNRGTITFSDHEYGCLRRVEGTLEVRVFVLGRMAEKVIHDQAVALLNSEAAAMVRRIEAG